MRLLFITPYFYPAEAYGGPIVVTASLCQSYGAAGVEVVVLSSDADGGQRVASSGRWEHLWPGVEVHYSRRLLFELWAPGQGLKALSLMRWADVVYVWGTFFWALPLMCAFNWILKRPLIVSTGGMLFSEALARKPWKKRLYLALVAPFGCPLFHIHASSEAEAMAVKRQWPYAKVSVIPHGVDIPAEHIVRQSTTLGNRPNPYFLYLGRLHPHKRVEGIVRAFARAVGKNDDGCTMTDDRKEKASVVGGRWSVEEEVGGGCATVISERSSVNGPWSLTIAGDGDPSYRRELARVAREAGVADRVRFVGHVSGEEKTRLLAQAEGLVLASYSENFGMSVAEALAHGSPCVVTKAAPWEGLEREGCGFWVDDSEEALAAGMRRLMVLSPEERREMGARGRAWMAREFSWEGVGRRMIELYERVIEEKKSAGGGRGG